MSGAESVVALVMLEWTAGLVGAAAWNQSWNVVRRGHFRIVAWCGLAFAVLALVLLEVSLGGEGDRLLISASAVAVLALAFLAVQYVRSETPGVVAGVLTAAAGGVALFVAAGMIHGWTAALAGASLVAGAVLLGGVTNGMLLGHWYLNQPGLKPWALGRLTALTLGAIVASGLLGLVAAGILSDATTAGAVLGLPGFGQSFGLAFYLIWLALIVTTGVVVWAARRCVQIRSIQSATGLYYVALLTAGVAEFLVRYLMVNAA
jgi:hypothetical protein